MLKIENLSFYYPNSQIGIEGVNLSVPRGQLLAILGQSGSGKSTLLNLIAGFIQPHIGQIKLNNIDITYLTPQARNLGIVFQHYALFPHMSVLENIAYPLKMRKISRAQRIEQAKSIATKVGLQSHFNKKPESLSGGQQQRVALARALIFEPAALLLDEPLSALDAGLRQSMREEICEIQTAFNITTLLITHDQEEAMSMADEVAILQQGKLLQVAPPEQIYSTPVNREVAAFIGRANFIECQVLAQNTLTSPLGEITANTGELRPGDKVTAMIRPESIQVKHAIDNCFTGKPIQRVFCGPIAQVVFDVGQFQFKIEGQLPHVFDHISIHPDAIHLIKH